VPGLVDKVFAFYRSRAWVAVFEVGR